MTMIVSYNQVYIYKLIIRDITIKENNRLQEVK